MEGAAGGENEEAREEKNWRTSVLIFRIGSDERRRKSGAGERLFWAREKIGQRIEPLLEH